MFNYGTLYMVGETIATTRETFTASASRLIIFVVCGPMAAERGTIMKYRIDMNFGQETVSIRFASRKSSASYSASYSLQGDLKQVSCFKRGHTRVWSAALGGNFAAVVGRWPIGLLRRLSALAEALATPTETCFCGQGPCWCCPYASKEGCTATIGSVHPRDLPMLE